LPYIKVNINKLRNYSTELSSIKSKVSRIKSDFSSLSSALDWDVKSASNIRNRTNNIVGDLGSEVTSLTKMSGFLNSTSSTYTNLDEKKPNNNTYTSSYKVAQNVERVELTEEETDEIIAQLAADEGVPKENIVRDIKNGLEPAQKWLSKIDKYLGKFEKGVRYITGATDLAFKFKDGQVIVSQFTRSGILNHITKFFHGKGIATHYNPSTLIKTPGVGTIYTINRIAHAAEVVAGIAEGAVKVLDAGAKIVDVLNDDTKSKEKKACDITAIGITSVTAAALDVAAPFAGKAVTTAVTALIPIPGVNIVAGVVAGVAVKGIISTAADVITSEAVVNQVSDSVGKVGSAVASGVQAVSDAGKALLESKNAGEAVANTAKLVGTAVVASAAAVGTAVVETTKVVATVAVETVKTVANKVVDTGKKVVNWFKSW